MVDRIECAKDSGSDMSLDTNPTRKQGRGVTLGKTIIVILGSVDERAFFLSPKGIKTEVLPIRQQILDDMPSSRLRVGLAWAALVFCQNPLAHPQKAWGAEKGSGVASLWRNIESNDKIPDAFSSRLI